MRKNRMLVATLCTVAATLAVGTLCAQTPMPTALGTSARVRAAIAPAPSPTGRKAVAVSALKSVAVTEAEKKVAESHRFLASDVVRATSEDQVDGPSLIPAPKVTTAPQPRFDVKKFGETVHSLFKSSVRGYALGLRQNGKPIQTLIWDTARAPGDGGKGWTLDTRMHIASISKLITAIAAVRMLHERNLPFSTPIGEYLPSYWTVGQNIANRTFAELLTHKAHFDVYDGDYLSFKKQVETGVKLNQGIGYTNGSFSLVRVLTATMTNAVPADTSYTFGGLLSESVQDALWDRASTKAFLQYAQARVFTPSGVSNVTTVPLPGSNSAIAYAGPSETKGWDSGDTATQLGGAGFRLSVNEVLNVLGTFRRAGTIVPAAKAQEALDASLGIDRIINSPRGKMYEKNGAWRTGSSPSADIEQCVAYVLPDDMELVVFVNSWVGSGQASLRNTVRDAYLASID